MNKSTTIDATTAKKILSELEEFEKLKTHLLRLIPDGVIPYGSKLWWEKEILNGEKDIKKGMFKTYKNAKNLISDLHKGI